MFSNKLTFDYSANTFPVILNSNLSQLPSQRKEIMAASAVYQPSVYDSLPGLLDAARTLQPGRASQEPDCVHGPQL